MFPHQNTSAANSKPTTFKGSIKFGLVCIELGLTAECLIFRHLTWNQMKTFIIHLFLDELKTLLGLFLGHNDWETSQEINTEEEEEKEIQSSSDP